MTALPAPVRTAEELTAHVRQAFPPDPADAGDGDRLVEVVHLDAGTIRIRRRTGARDLRPGDSVAGPVLFSLVDSAAWLMTLAHLEPGRDALTSSLSMQFLRRPPAGELIAEGRLLRLGRRFSVTDVLVYAGGDDRPVAQATVTYAPL
jgi:uncharacterized protein (TIGR00369 family)